MSVPLAVLAAVLDRLGLYEPSATLGDEVYESLARSGATMTNAAVATYAFDQIDQARAQLRHAD
jgi:hypothetical protein